MLYDTLVPVAGPKEFSAFLQVAALCLAPRTPFLGGGNETVKLGWAAAESACSFPSRT